MVGCLVIACGGCLLVLAGWFRCGNVVAMPAHDIPRRLLPAVSDVAAAVVHQVEPAADVVAVSGCGAGRVGLAGG